MLYCPLEVTNLDDCKTSNFYGKKLLRIQKVEVNLKCSNVEEPQSIIKISLLFYLSTLFFNIFFIYSFISLSRNHGIY